MDNFKTISVAEFKLSPFMAIGDDWMLINTKNDEKVNSMTASWGGLGVLWSHDASFIFVRDSRYTAELLQKEQTYSLSFLDHAKYAKDLSYLGTKSGRDADKLANTSLTIDYVLYTPIIKEANYNLICKIMTAQPLELANIRDPKVIEEYYPEGGYHRFYAGEILKVLKNNLCD